MAFDIQEGAQLGDYTIRSLLGSGGMASVYKAYDPGLTREVAIKVIRTTDQDPDFVKRFQREARVAANLKHPNIVQIHSIGEQDDVLYMVQELLTGDSLDKLIRKRGRGYIATARVHAIVSQLASALDFAHKQGVTHRDVKPSNAIYNEHEQLVLTDFGIARSESDPSRTATGPALVLGTPAYVAPEQTMSSSSKTITPACDIYSLGVVVFELLTAQLPFEGETTMEIVLKHINDDPPPPSSLRPDLPKAVDKVVSKALSKDPADRYESAGKLAQALQSAWPVDAAKGKSSSSSRSRGKSEQKGSSSSTTSTAKRDTSEKAASSSSSRSRGKSEQKGSSSFTASTAKRDTSEKAASSTASSDAATSSAKQKVKETTQGKGKQPKAKAQAPASALSAATPEASSETVARKIPIVMVVIIICIVGGLGYAAYYYAPWWMPYIQAYISF